MIALALVGVAAAAPQIDAELIDVTNVSVGLSGAKFTAVVELTRVSGPPMVLKDVDYDIVFNGEVIGGAGALPETVRLKKGEAVQVQLPGELTGGGNALIRAASTGKLEVRIVGEAKVRALLIPRTVDFETEVLKVE
ncbi:MAG: hypothetical protein GY913_12670 [Proteobacteria bacterium]|nr:hypothetical protein [Pseudomonadota bacterium]MCP4917759.1 hypothetical protein [Pseudomonadota bacterium]